MFTLEGYRIWVAAVVPSVASVPAQSELSAFERDPKIRTVGGPQAGLEAALLDSRAQLCCDSLLCMAQSGRFGLSLRILTVLASEPDAMHTSAEIAAKLSESAVMVRRCFLLLHKKGFIEQRKGPHGGARLKLSPKQIGLGDIYVATEGDWLAISEPTINRWSMRTPSDARMPSKRAKPRFAKRTH